MADAALPNELRAELLGATWRLTGPRNVDGFTDDIARMGAAGEFNGMNRELAREIARRYNAAPDLLAALERLLRDAKRFTHHERYESMAPALVDAENAVIKARGGA